MTLDTAALRQALAKTPGASTDGLETTHTLLCRREAPAFQRAAKSTTASGDELLVACTQERRLFLELNAATEGAASVEQRPIHFVNIREAAGWSRDRAPNTPKIAALIAAAQLPAPDPVPVVSYRSAGRCLVIGDGETAERAATMLEDKLDVSVLVEGSSGAIAQTHGRATAIGRLTRLTGWLGAFDATWQSHNPIDLDLCTRCNACVDACPEGAIGLDYQVDLAACKSHRDCTRVCDAAGAIDFARPPQDHEERFDLVLDLRPAPAFGMHQLPQGYFHPGRDDAALAQAVLALREMTGEFEKPKFFRYNAKICAHSRNEQVGCDACIEVCSARAIRSDASRKGKTAGKSQFHGVAATPGVSPVLANAGGGVVVEPHLCVGCGACSTVCPTGAMAFGYPDAVDLGKRIRTMLGTYQQAGGRDVALLLHSQAAGQRLLDELGRAARVDRALQGLPARVLPLALWHTASVGLDLWLAAIAQGASQIWVLLTDEEAPEYRQALTEQMAVAESILQGLGYEGRHLQLLEARDARDLAALDTALRAPPARGVARPAAFTAQAAKRGTLELALDHLLAQAPGPVDEIALPAAGAPFGSLVVDTDKCTLVPELRGRLPGQRAGRQPRQAAAAFHRKQLRAVRPVRHHLPRAGHPPAAPTVAGRRRPRAQGAAGAQRGRALPLRALQQALRHAAGHRGDDRQARCAPGLPGRGGRAAEDVRRLPGHRHPHQPGRSPHHGRLNDGPRP